MLIIGELINCTRKKVGAAAAARDVEFFKEIARGKRTPARTCWM